MKKILVFLCLLLSACSVDTYKLGIVSPYQSSFTYDALEHAPAMFNVSASQTTPIILFIPIGHPHFDQTVDQVLKAGQGNLLLDAVVTEETDWFILFGYRRLNISGTVVNIRN